MVFHHNGTQDRMPTENQEGQASSYLYLRSAFWSSVLKLTEPHLGPDNSLLLVSMHAGFCTFDERNAGGRYQTQAELRRFKHVLKNTLSMVDKGDPKCMATTCMDE